MNETVPFNWQKCEHDMKEIAVFRKENYYNNMTIRKANNFIGKTEILGKCLQNRQTIFLSGSHCLDTT